MSSEKNITEPRVVRHKRSHISTRSRFEIFKRDGFKCQYCGNHPPNVLLHVDHIVAVANGGDNSPENLTTACEKCNLGKSSVPLTAVPASLPEVAERAREMSEQLKAHGDMIRAARDAHESMAWDVAEVLEAGASNGWSRDKFNGVSNFVKRLGYAQTLDAALIANDAQTSTQRRFKYFCAVCWNRIRDAE